LPAGKAPLSQSRDSALAEAHVGARGSKAKYGARNSEIHNPIWARPDARVGGMEHYPDYGKC